MVVPELGRDSDVAGNGFANHRSGDESCRRVWLVALGAGVPKGVGSQRPIRTLDVAPTVAQILGFKMVECEGRPLPELAFREDECFTAEHAESAENIRVFLCVLRGLGG